MEKYNVDVYKMSNYDLVIDTTHASPEENYELIDEKLTKWLNNETFDRTWVNKSGKWESIKD